MEKRPYSLNQSIYFCLYYIVRIKLLIFIRALRSITNVIIYNKYLLKFRDISIRLYYCCTFYLSVVTIPTGRPPLFQPTKLLMAIRIVLWFFSSVVWVFHISLRICKTQPRRWKKRRTKSWAWISPKRKKGEVCDTFLAFCASVS